MRHSINKVRRRGAEEDEDDEEDEEEDVEAYDENADEDFNPETAAATAASDEDGSSSSSEEEETTKTKKRGRPAGGKRKRARSGTAASANAIAEELDSGDEATIRERDHRKKRRRKQNYKNNKPEASSDDSAGASDSESAGSVIKTRAARQAARTQKAQQRRRPTTLGASTADVDRLWAELAAIPLGRATPHAHAHPSSQDQNSTTSSAKRKVQYAGEVIEVSAEDAELLGPGAKASKRQQEAQSEDKRTSEESQADDTTLPHRPLRRQSIFEPNPMGTVKGIAADKLRTWLARNQLGAAASAITAVDSNAPPPPPPIAPWRKAQAAQRLTTVQKSALDWRGFVDASAGLKDELDAYGKSKKGFLAREAFLDRAQGAREVAAREARLKG